MAFQVNLNIFLLITISLALVMSQDPHDEFLQWDRVKWIKPSTDNILLPCYHPVHYPFNDTNAIVKAEWILPEAMAYRHMKEGDIGEGYIMLSRVQQFELVITKQDINVPDSVNGMYVCAALAHAFPNTMNTSYAWYYLRWGVGLYTNVPAMNSGTLGEKYYMCFTYAWVSVLVSLVIILIFSLTVHFKYKGGPDFAAFEKESDLDSLSLSVGEKLSSDAKKSKTLAVDVEEKFEF